MEFLGKLGIDVKLLIAQVVNFALLLWVLKKFLYHPLMNRVEADERKLREAEEKAKQLEEEKQAFAKQKEEETAEAKQRVQEMMTEAEELAEQVRGEAHEKAKRETDALLVQAEAKREAGAADFRKMLRAGLVKRLKENVAAALGDSVSADMRESFQKNVFFDGLLDALRALRLDNVGAEALEGAARELKENRQRGGKRAYRREAEELLAERIGPVVWEYALPVTPAEEKKLGGALRRKLGVEPQLVKKQNEALVSGFRLEVAGNLISCNLSNVVAESFNHAVGTES